jgi:hypothetical protein
VYPQGARVAVYEPRQHLHGSVQCTEGHKSCAALCAFTRTQPATEEEQNACPLIHVIVSGSGSSGVSSLIRAFSSLPAIQAHEEASRKMRAYQTYQCAFTFRLVLEPLPVQEQWVTIKGCTYRIEIHDIQVRTSLRNVATRAYRYCLKNAIVYTFLLFNSAHRITPHHGVCTQMAAAERLSVFPPTVCSVLTVDYGNLDGSLEHLVQLLDNWRESEGCSCESLCSIRLHAVC